MDRGQSLASYISWGHKESDITEQLSLYRVGTQSMSSVIYQEQPLGQSQEWWKLTTSPYPVADLSTSHHT